MTPKTIATIRAARAAAAQREANEKARAPVIPRLRTGKRTAEAIAALTRDNARGLYGLNGE